MLSFITATSCQVSPIAHTCPILSIVQTSVCEDTRLLLCEYRERTPVLIGIHEAPAREISSSQGATGRAMEKSSLLQHQDSRRIRKQETENQERGDMLPRVCNMQGSIHNLLRGCSGLLSAARNSLSAAGMRNFTSNKALPRKGSYLQGQSEGISSSDCFSANSISLR